jgi:hypothetical protein
MILASAARFREKIFSFLTLLHVSRIKQLLYCTCLYWALFISLGLSQLITYVLLLGLQHYVRDRTKVHSRIPFLYFFHE